jgi:hypothetical protein
MTLKEDLSEEIDKGQTQLEAEYSGSCCMYHIIIYAHIININCKYPFPLYIDFALL